MIEQRQERQTAYKIWISDLHKGDYVKTAGEWEPNYIDVKALNVSRVNLIGYVLEKFENPDKSYTSISIDDKSGVLQVRAWREDIGLFNEIKVGDLVLIIGKVKDFNGKIYATPEIVRKLDNPLWAKLRKMELEKNYGPVERIETENTEAEFVDAGSPPSQEEEGMPAVVEERVVEEKVSNENTKVLGEYRKKLLESISKLDTNNGADKGLVLSQAGLDGEEGEKFLEELLKEGEIFEISPGKLRTTI